MQQHNYSKVANQRVAALAVVVALLMVGASYAAVPLYDLFCRVTGYGGTTQIAEQAPNKISGKTSDRIITVRFDASLNRDMPWQFSPPPAIALPVGESSLAFYTARNLTDEPITGTATYNVSPPEAGFYFAKIDCFCFTEQVLQPDQAVQLPVSFFISPEILTDSQMDSVKTITLSYTFFKSRQQAGDKILPQG